MRRTHIWLLTLVLLTAGLAGCIGGEDGTGDEAGTRSGDPGSSPGDGSDRVDQGSDQRQAQVQETRQEVPVDDGGTVGTWAYACMVTACFGRGLPLPADQVVEVRAEGGPVAAELTVAFDRPDGQVKELGVILTQSDPCNGEGCEVLAYAQGTSPIEISETGLSTDPDKPLRIVVFHPYRGTGVGGAQGGVQTDYTVTGTVTHLVPAGG